MLFPMFRSMEELKFISNQSSKSRIGRGYTSHDAMQNYLKLTNKMNQNLKRKRAISIIAQAQKQ